MARLTVTIFDNTGYEQLRQWWSAPNPVSLVESHNEYDHNNWGKGDRVRVIIMLCRSHPWERPPLSAARNVPLASTCPPASSLWSRTLFPSGGFLCGQFFASLYSKCYWAWKETVREDPITHSRNLSALLLSGRIPWLVYSPNDKNNRNQSLFQHNMFHGQGGGGSSGSRSQSNIALKCS